MGREKGQSAVQYLMVIGIGSMVAVLVIFLLISPFQSARKKASRRTTKAACQIQTGIDEYMAKEKYNGTQESAPEQLIDKTENKTFNKTGSITPPIPTEEKSPDCAYNSTIEGSCKINGYNLSLVNHPCGHGAAGFQKALYLNKTSGGWVNYTRIK